VRESHQHENLPSQSKLRLTIAHGFSLLHGVLARECGDHFQKPGSNHHMCARLTFEGKNGPHFRACTNSQW
jgi:hypothetical protein